MCPPARPIILGLMLALTSSLAAAGDDRPVAMVDEVRDAPEAGVQKFQYVYVGDKIDLRDNGVLTLAYFDSCEVVTFTGGVVKLKKEGTAISKGGAAEKTVQPCETAALAANEQASEAGAAVKRISPFMGEQWREIATPSEHPVFIWPPGEDGDYTISIYYLDAAPVELVWQAPFHNGLEYPADAPALQPGLPYKAVITNKGKEKISAVFSIDPGLELPDGPLTSAIPLGL